MKKSILSMVLIISMLVLSLTPAFAQQMTSIPPTFNPSDMENMSKELEKALQGLDQLDSIDIDNMQSPVEATPKPVAATSTIETNMMIAAGDGFTLGLKTNGTVVATGLSLCGADQVTDWTSITMISCGLNHSVGLKADGTVVAAGSNATGACDVGSWKDIVKISAGLDNTVGLKKDGTVVSAGSNDHSQLDVSSWKDIKDISTGAFFTVAAKNDGTALAIGKDCSGILNVSGWRDIVAVSASFDNIVGLKKDGTVLNTMRTNTALFKNVKAIAASAGYEAGLNKDGTVVTNNETINTSTWKDIIAISAGAGHLVGLKSDGTVLAVRANDSFGLGTNVSGWMLKVPTINAKVTSLSTNTKITANDKKFTIQGYTIDKNLYVKIRDLASVLKGATKKFSVDGDGVKKPIKLVSKGTYKAIGGELKKADEKSREATKATTEIYIDGKKVKFTTYKINNEIYFKLHDIMQKFNIFVGWDTAGKSIILDTKKAHKVQ